MRNILHGISTAGIAVIFLTGLATLILGFTPVQMAGEIKQAGCYIRDVRFKE